MLEDETKELTMNRTPFLVLSFVSALSLAACTGASSQAPVKGQSYSQGPADSRLQAARNAPFDRSVMRDHTMPATVM
jgi:hypothetical protein